MQPLDSRLIGLRDWLPGQVLHGTGGGQYHVRERVGEGGQGWVFSANWDDPSGYLVIVKVLRPDAVTPEALVRFQREAQVLRMLGQAARPNPHVVRFFDHAAARLSPPSGGEPIELPFTVLEYVRGPTLEQVLEPTRGVGMALDRTLRIARQIVLALEDVHAHKIVHRDLKPSNVLLATEGGAEVAKVTDFGLAKVVEVGLGRTTSLAGATLGYAPPEQFEQGNRRVSARTDVFSFSAILYEMLSGVKAFPHGDGENPLVVVTRLLNGPRPSLLKTRGVLPRELATRPDLVERLDALLFRASAAEPTDRHPSIGALWGVVEPLLREALSRPTPPHGIAATATDVPTAMDLPAPPPFGPRPGLVPPRSREAVDSKSRLPTAPTERGQGSPARAWTWRIRVPPIGPKALRGAVFDVGGEAAVAVGAAGILRWERSGWTRSPAFSEVDARSVLGLAWLRPGDLIAFGSGGLAGRLVPGAGLESWPLPDSETSFLGAHVDAPGTMVTLVGERPAPRVGRGAGESRPTLGVVAQFSRGRLALLSEVPACARLRGVTRLRSGEIVACGDLGGLVRVELGVPEYLGSVCGGNLHSIAALPEGGAVTIGAGGHALALAPRLKPQLEPVQTTRDLFALGVDPEGVAWAGSAKARLLRRTEGSWIRMGTELGLSSSVVALWPAPGVLRAICDDGAVIEGLRAG